MAPEERHVIVRRRGMMLAVVAAVGLGLASCGAAVEEATEQAIEQGTGGDVEIDDDGVKVTDEEGNTSAFGSQASVPEDWPSDIPVPDGTVLSSASYPDGKQVTVQPDGDALAAYNDIRSQVEAAGYTVRSTTDVGGSKSTVLFKPSGAENESAGTIVTVSYAGEFINGEDAISVTVNTQS